MAEWLDFNSRTDNTDDFIYVGAGKIFINLDILPLMSETVNFLDDIQPFLRENWAKAEFTATRGGNTLNRNLDTREIPIDGDEEYDEEISSNSASLVIPALALSPRVQRVTIPMERDPDGSGALVPSTTFQDFHNISLLHVVLAKGNRGAMMVYMPRAKASESVSQEFVERGESMISATFTGRPGEVNPLTRRRQRPYYIWQFDANGNLMVDDNAVSTPEERIAADRLLVEALTLEIPPANQTNQSTRTNWVRQQILNVLRNGSNLNVSFAGGYDYKITLTIDDATDGFVITITEEM